jgi:hypothetical protein
VKPQVVDVLADAVAVIVNLLVIDLKLYNLFLKNGLLKSTALIIKES